jgi:metallo-beta-lactamase superfamily protein
MSKFIAIPVTQGDAFYLEREGFSVLTDGGYNQSDFPSLFKKKTKTDSVNVVICTHNDADHANGILGFLEAGLQCDEVWLPGRWLSVLPDVLKPFVEVFDELVKNIEATDKSLIKESPQSSLSPIESYAECEYDSRTNDSPSEEGPSVAEGGWPESYVKQLEQAKPSEFLFHGYKDCPFWSHCHYRRLEPAGVQLLWSAIDAAAQIRNIATEAFHRGIPIRWFEYNISPPSGGRQELLPVNAREIAKVHPRSGLLLDMLALTVQNKESLVFWSPPTNQHPGVLFTADSDLANINLPPNLDNAIVTAPHHGSETNANAYGIVTTTASNITWVRSDGEFKSRPGSTYLGLNSRRLCTLCRRSGVSFTTKQTVKFYSRKRMWIRQASQFCSCK